MLSVEAADVEQARRTYTDHQPVIIGGRAVCSGCGDRFWPCRPARRAIVVLISHGTFDA